jgi:hypothetical protein
MLLMAVNDMDQALFEDYLKRRGKKPHVIDGLVRKVDLFEKKLTRQGISFENPGGKTLIGIIQEFENHKKGDGKKIARGVALYYKAIGKAILAAAASSFREKEIAKTRNAFPLNKITIIDPAHIALLKKQGIVNNEQFLKFALTAADRKKQSLKTGIPPAEIMKIARLSDLTRLFAIKGVRAALYYQSGYETIEKLAAADPEKLRQYLIGFIRDTGFKGIAPLPKELKSTIETAKKSKSVVR